MRSITRLGIVALALASGSLTVMAQEAGTLQVSVRDNSGKPVSGALIAIKSPTQIGGTKTARTDESGRARFGNLYPGLFEVRVSQEGFRSASVKDVRVSLSVITPVDFKIGRDIGETVDVVASAATVDATSVTTSTHLGLSTVEALPTARTYTDYLKLAPGIVANPGSDGDFALAGSLAKDNTGDQGARNNTYVLDGVDSTNPVTGRSFARFNTEIIQEQEVKTGGITADVAARGGGAVSNVVTKSGGNQFAGSLNYYLQNDSLYGSRSAAAVEVLGEQAKFSSYDTAFTLGGPIMKDRWWFFTSVQKVYHDEKGNYAAAATPTLTAKNPSSDEIRAFLKTTFQLNPNNRLEASLTRNKQTEKSQGLSTNIPSRDFDQDTTQQFYNIKYEGTFGDWFLQGKLFNFSDEYRRKPLTAAGRVNIIYPSEAFGGVPASSDVPTYMKRAGGFGTYSDLDTNRDGFSVDVTRAVQGLFGDHVFKAGFVQQTEERITTRKGSGSDNADYENIMTGSINPTMAQLFEHYSGSSWGADANFVRNTITDMVGQDQGLASYLNTLPGATLTDKINAIPFATPDPRNPSWGTYEYRIRLTKSAPSPVKRKALDYYLQDTWTLPENRFTVVLGARFNKDSYYASTGEKLHTTELNVAPRIGITYNHKGENKFKLFANYGRYFEPIKLDMVNFAGTLGTEQVEELYLGGSYNGWLPLRYRGGTTVFDCMMAPSLQSPYTDETRLGLQHNLGGGWDWELVYSHREDKRIVEDFGLDLYTDPDALEPDATVLKNIKSVYGGTDDQWINTFRGLAYPLSHFGLSSIPDNYNYVLANLIGAKREFDTLDATLRYNDDNWNFMASYTFIKAMGNTLSSGDADFQGDEGHQDPRLPWMYGYLPGSSDFSFKTYLSYTFREGWAKGITVGGTYFYLSPWHWTRGNAAYGRVLPGPYLENFDREPGTRYGHAFNQLDLRVKYDWNITKKIKGEAFIDIFNARDRQGPTAVAESVQGAAGVKTGGPTNFQEPRRFYAGFRLSF